MDLLNKPLIWRIQWLKKIKNNHFYITKRVWCIFSHLEKEQVLLASKISVNQGLQHVLLRDCELMTKELRLQIWIRSRIRRR